MSKQGIIAAAIVILSVTVTVLLIKSRKPAEPRPPDVAAPLVEFIVAAQADHVIPVVTQGTVSAKNETEIAPEVAGTVTWMAPNFTAGGSFKPGQPLLRLDDREYRLAAETAKARIAQAELHLRQVEAEAEQSKREWARLSDAPPTELAAREPFVAEAKASAEAARADADRAQLALSRTEVRAPPYAGVVQGVATGIGQFISPGRPIAKVFSVDHVQVRLPFTDKQRKLAGLPPPGELLKNPLPVTLSALIGGQNQIWNAKLVQTEAVVDPRTRVMYAVAEVEADPSVAALSVGQFVSAKIEGRALPGIVDLPRSALRSEDRVFIADAEGRLDVRPVEVLQKGDDSVAIEKGIADGERVIVTPIDYPVAGMKVDARPAPDAEAAAATP